MNVEHVFGSTVKVVTRSYGVSNDPAVAGSAYVTEALAGAGARLLLLENSRFATIGNVTFLIGRPAFSWMGTEYPFLADTDMADNEEAAAEVWIATHDIISVVEEA